MQDMEFTIENGKLFMLQTRNGKRTAAAALKIAVDLVAEGMISKTEALMKIDPKQLDALLHPTFQPEALKAATPIAKGLPASPGAASGRIYFDADDATAADGRGEKVILVRLETLSGRYSGHGCCSRHLTGRGMTSHAAVVAAGWVNAVSQVALKSRSMKNRNSLSPRAGNVSMRVTGYPLTAHPVWFTSARLTHG